MEFRDIGRAIRRNIVLIALVLLLAIGAAVGYSALVTPTYQATTKVLFSVESSGGISDVVAGNTYLTQRIQTLVPLSGTPLILDPVIDELGLDATSAELAGSVEVAVEGVGTTVSIVAESSDPQSAVDLSTAVAESFISQVTQIDSGSGGSASTTTLRADVVQPAILPTVPSSPNWPLNIGIALAVGLVIAAAAVALRTATDPRVRDSNDVAAALGGLPTLGSVPRSRKPRLDMVSNPTGTVADAYRKLRTNAVHRFEGVPAASLLVASPSAGDGTTTVAVNLSVALAEAGEQVTLVDADLRHSRLADRLGLNGAPGLAEVLRGDVPLQDAVQTWSATGIRVLTAGAPTAQASELLGSPALNNVLTGLYTRGGIIVIDSPPALPYADAVVLADKARLVLLVARRGRTRKRALAQAHKALSAVGSVVIGATLTGGGSDDATTV